MTPPPLAERQPAPPVRVFYLDASALVKRYLSETGSDWVESLCANVKDLLDAAAAEGLQIDNPNQHS